MEKLNVRYCDGITYANIAELKYMPKLRVLNFHGRIPNLHNNSEQENLKKIMPLVRFDESVCPDERKLLPADGIWDVEAKQLEYFEKFGRCGFKRLPNELISHLIDPLERRDLLNFGQVSKRMRAITQEKIQSRH